MPARNPYGPYIALSPATAERGRQVTIYGRNFCAVGCSPLTVTVGARAVVAAAPVGANGTFQVHFTVTDVPGVYTVTVRQAGAAGAVLVAATRLIVPVVDRPSPTRTPLPITTPTSTLVATSTPTRTPAPPTATTTPLAGASITAAPTSGIPYQHITVTGAHFGPTEAVKIFWDSTAATPLATPITLANGSFAATITVPQARLGAHTLIAVGQTSHRTASAAFQVKPAVFLSPTSGKVGASVTMSAVGFGAGETVAALWSPGFSVLGSATSNAVGSTVVHFIVPSKAPGSYQVVGYGVTTKAAAAAPFTVTP